MVGAGLRFFAVMDCPGKRGEVGLSLTVAIRITVTPSTSAELCRRKFFLTRRLSAYGSVRVLQSFKSSPHSRHSTCRVR